MQNLNLRPWIIVYALAIVAFVNPSAIFGATSQIAVATEQFLLLPMSYKDVLSRLEGEQATREMFASQQIELRAFKPRTKPEDGKSNSKQVDAAIDILGCSAEFGGMPYEMLIVASDKRASITVQLMSPAGMVCRQRYQFEIAPSGDQVTSLVICHQLAVDPPATQIRFINRVIARVAQEKTQERLSSLTSAMAHCITDLVNRPASAEPSTQHQESSATKRKAENRDEAKDILSGSSQDQKKKADPTKPVLRVVLHGLTGSEGSVRLAIFNDREQFEKFDARKTEAKQGEAFRKRVSKIEDQTEIVLEFSELPPGKYVIAAFQDQDNNGKLNSSLLGFPTERYGFSRDARGRLGAPDFQSAEIEIFEQNQEIRIELK